MDGETVADVESYGVERWLGELARDLKDGAYAPKPVRQVLIPKKQPGKFRPLGIPCIRDRVAQTSATLVLDADIRSRPATGAVRLQAGTERPWRDKDASAQPLVHGGTTRLLTATCRTTSAKSRMSSS